VKWQEIVHRLGLIDLTPELGAATALDVTAGYASDLLSDVLANAPEGGVLVTMQVHLNVIAVCVHAGVAAVVFTAGRKPEEAVRTKAVEEGVRLYGAKESTFDIVGRLYELGLRSGG
jgi:hypothetical protein